MPVLELQPSTAPNSGPKAVRRVQGDGRVVQQFEEEVDGYLAQMLGFGRLDLGEVFAQLAAISARLTAIRVTCVRQDTRMLAAFRTRQLDPLLEEVDRQFRSWSRQLAVRQQEWEISKGGI